jgi:hypothetical protein
MSPEGEGLNRVKGKNKPRGNTTMWGAAAGHRPANTRGESNGELVNTATVAHRVSGELALLDLALLRLDGTRW